MANIFQTTTGYRDPQKAMTLKALEARAKAAQEATTAAMQPQVIAAPEQGWAQMLGALGANIQQGRAESAEMEGRANLARLMSGVNMETGPDMATIAQIGQHDPELAKAMYDQAMRTRQENLDREDRQSHEAGESLAERQLREKLETERNALTVSENALQRGSTEGIASANRTSQEGIATTNNQAEMARTVESKRLENDYYKLESMKDSMSPEAYAAAKTELDNQALKIKNEAEAAAPVTYEAPVSGASLPKESGVDPNTAYQKSSRGELKRVEPDPVLKPSDMYTPAQEAREKALGEEVAVWDTNGNPNALNDIQQTKKAIDLLKNGDITGFRQGVVANYLPSAVANWYNPEGTIAMNAIRETVQNTLRESLGAQFTEKEGVALMERAFDPSIGEPENIRRAQLLLEQISAIAETKNAMSTHLRTHGNFIGYTAPDSVSGKAKLMELLATDYGTRPADGAPATTPPPAAGAPDIDELIRQANEP